MSMQLSIMGAVPVPPLLPPQCDPSLQIVRARYRETMLWLQVTQSCEEIVGRLRAQTLRRGLFRSNQAH
jgi:hypothetical protein